VQGGSVVNWPFYRQLISRTGSTYARTMLGLKIKDMTAGYRAFRRTTLEKLDLDAVESVGYGFQVDLAWRVAKMGLKVVEVPVTFVERELGSSKMSGNIVVEAMLNVTKWGVADRLKQLSGRRQG
jgi:dolichol-phosphate mannosyltransferase